MDIQLYFDDMRLEREDNANLGTFTNVDISMLLGQLNINDILHELDYADVMEYYRKQREDE